MTFIPNDPFFASQWHLRNVTPGEYDLNVLDVWDDYDGSGVEVVAIDLGFDFNHLDYDNYRTDLDWDFEDNDASAFPDPDPDPFNAPAIDAHGTPVLGLIGAAQDGQGTVGIAFGADIIGYKTTFNRAQVAAGIDRAVAFNHDVVNMSYGEFDRRIDNGSEVFIQRSSLIASVNSALQDGRVLNGTALGTILVKSAGNARGSLAATDREETTGEAMDSHRGTIVVAGVNRDGGVNAASSPGSSVLVSSFYGSVRTTDISGNAGYAQISDGSNGAFTNFNGTSAAAPQVAGVAALMLDANPTLGWRDVQTILAYSARHVGSSVTAAARGNEQATSGAASWFWNDAENWNGGGMHVSNDYGFGLVDAKAAVRLAETWQYRRHSGNDAFTTQDGLNSEATIAAGSSSGGARFFIITESTDIEIEHVELTVNFTQLADTEDLEIFLRSPEGTRIQLIRQTGDNDSFTGTWRFGATGFRGEGSAGNWRVEIRDKDNANTSPIAVNNLVIRTWGALDGENDLFVYTNEFSEFAGLAGHSTAIAGGTGTDTINAAAVDAGMTIDLRNGQGVIDGEQVTISGIETVYAGDGDDALHDGAGTNRLYGMRGNDRLYDTAAGGNDRYYGGAGNDVMFVTSSIGGDAFYGQSGRDTINWTQSAETTAVFDLAASEARDGSGNVEVMTGFENLVGTAQDDTIIESASNNVIDGYRGNDLVIVSTVIAADAWRGGPGSDTIDWSAVNETGATFDLAAGAATDANGNTEIMVAFENLLGTENADTIIENRYTNDIKARGGNDLVLVTSRIVDDSFTGGFGVDTIDWTGSPQADGIYDISGGTARIGRNIETMSGFENFLGTNQSDTIIEGSGTNAIDAQGGNDFVEVHTVIGLDSFEGGAGIDTIDWGGTSEIAAVFDLGTGTAISADGGSREAMTGFENLYGTQSADVIRGSASANILRGMAGNDIIAGRGGNDNLVGGDGNDRMVGGGGNDFLYGDSGNDQLHGGGGADQMMDGTGRDRMFGGAGADEFELVVDTDLDRIMDFQFGLDLIGLNGFSFGGLNLVVRLRRRPS